jgi:hypothetical protein
VGSSAPLMDPGRHAGRAIAICTTLIARSSNAASQ